MCDMIGGGSVVPYAWLIVFTLNVLITMFMPVFGFIADVITSHHGEGDHSNQNSNSNSSGVSEVKFHQIAMNPIHERVTDGETDSTGIIDSPSHEQSHANVEYGIRVVLLFGTYIFMVGSVPCFLLIATKVQLCVYLALGVMGVGMCAFSAAMPAYIVSSIANKDVRYSVLGIAFNLASLLFAGTAPLIQTSLVMYSWELNHGFDHDVAEDAESHTISSGLFPGIYISIVGAISFTVQCIQWNAGTSSPTDQDVCATDKSWFQRVNACIDQIMIVRDEISHKYPFHGTETKAEGCLKRKEMK